MYFPLKMGIYIPLPTFFSVVYIPTVLIPTVFPWLLWCWKGGSRDPRTGSDTSSAGGKTLGDIRYRMYICTHLYLMFVIYVSCICNVYMYHIVLYTVCINVYVSADVCYEHVHLSLLYLYFGGMSTNLTLRSIHLQIF